MLVDCTKFKTDDSTLAAGNDSHGQAGEPQDIGATAEMSMRNFLLGSVNGGRLEHENVVQRTGLAHWRRNETKQQKYEDQVLHAGALGAIGRPNHVQRATNWPAAVTQTHGMGLDRDNLQSFMSTGTRLLVVISDTTAGQDRITPQVAEAVPAACDLPVAEETSNLPTPVVEHTPGGLSAKGASRLRAVKCQTFTNMLARPLTTI